VKIARESFITFCLEYERFAKLDEFISKYPGSKQEAWIEAGIKIHKSAKTAYLRHETFKKWDGAYQGICKALEVSRPIVSAAIHKFEAQLTTEERRARDETSCSTDLIELISHEYAEGLARKKSLRVVANEIIKRIAEQTAARVKAQKNSTVLLLDSLL
jgi:hypothetical protein